MESDDYESFEQIGCYSPRDAERLMLELEARGIDYRAASYDRVRKQVNYEEKFRQGAEIMLFVDAIRIDEVPDIQALLFGDCTPNYESSYFKKHPPEGSAHPSREAVGAVPFGLRAVAILFCGSGAIASIYTILSIPYIRHGGHFVLYLGIFHLPIGFGLFRGRESSRRWAESWILLTGAIMALGIFAVCFYPNPLQASGIPQDLEASARLGFFRFGIGTLAFLAWVYHLLCSERVQEYFDKMKRASGPNPDSVE